MKSSRDVLRRFLEISNRGWIAALANREATAQLIVERHQPKLSVAYQAGSLALMEKIIGAETGLGGISRMRRETWIATPGATPALVDALVDGTVLTP
jgi:hypothetical protein